MTYSKELEQYLTEEPKARERCNKDRAIVNILVYKHGLVDIDRVKLTNFVKDYASLDREWRRLLAEKPALRGTDYDDGKKLEQEYILNAGYEVGYHRRKKLLINKIQND